ncbi:4-alpha-glucanotransferase [Humitalea rosea]|uniref:4-alpha-glucanotransferase n=1 Tax=Humitalea rosea TaxID=990373 RepID=A0A2W7JE82_9PROT|nr:4-alpha-glucanotransferase [Humitalea rosea]PZW50522.1 4-alpha-glucanotransferase [Humitalea rosea]
MIDPDEALLRLASLHGIETAWQDALGRHRQVGLDTLRAMLRAIGSDPIDPVGALAFELHTAGGAALPPRLTGVAGHAVHIDVPSGRATQEMVGWRISTSDGAVTEGQAQPEPRGEAGCRLSIPLPSEAGEARLELSGPITAEAALTVAPPSCYLGPLADRRLWGLAAQVYGLRAPGDGGLGHFGALPPLMRAAAARGADMLAISPTHALFAADAAHNSPYSPSSRTQTNGWLADPGGLPEVASLAALVGELGLGDGLAELESSSLVNYGRAVPARLALLRGLFTRFSEQHLNGATALGDEFRAFRIAGGTTLEDHARFEALHAHQFAIDPSGWDWRRWPEALRDPRGAAVAAFAEARAMDVGFHAFLQWLSQRQLAAAQGAARAAGMAIGLVTDLAVGTHGGGSRAWSRSAALLSGVSIGAPPDVMNTIGQDWGLTTFAPSLLAKQGFAPFVEDLRAAMAHAGGVRLDHVMGLSRIWCIPQGEPPQHGAYLRFPLQDMLRLLAAESQRHRAVVVGEDLGTVQEGFRETLTEQAVMGIRVMFFERDSNGGFAPPDRYSTRVITMPTTHDLPTFAGWWKGDDIGLRAGLGLLPEGQTEASEWATREHERGALWHALCTHAGAEGEMPLTANAPLGAAVARFLGATPAALVVLPLEDAILQEEQVNLPGTTIQHPNWRRRLPRPAEEMLTETPAQEILGALQGLRRADA